MALLKNSSQLLLNVSSPHAEGHNKSNAFVMIFLFGGLALGLALQAALNIRWIKRFIRLPYTVCLLLIGFAIGLLIQALSRGVEEDAGDSIFSTFTMTNTDPHLIMQIFLPILIFDSSFKMEAHGVFKAFGQILLLAAVGLLLSTVMIGACMYGIVTIGQGERSWTFAVCLMFGSILSATDPVAVVSLLREMGANKQVVILTEGESLFNDGTAIIAYEIFLALARESLNISYGNSLVVSMMLQLSGIVISPLVGFVMAKICEVLLQKTFNDEIREKGIILISVYTTFFICELIHVSGVLALCVQGIWLSYKKHSISPETAEDNNKFWDFFNYWANTLVFLLAGMVIAKPVYQNSRHLDNAQDYWLIIAVYLIMNVARAAAIAILYPILCRIGYGLPYKHAIALTWGGLRGAIALLLSLQLREEPGFKAFEWQIGEKALLYVSGSVALTLLINATTFASLLGWFRLDEIPQHKLKVIRSALAHLQQIQQQVTVQLKDDRFLAEADWDLVAELSAIRNPYEAHELPTSNTDCSLVSAGATDPEQGKMNGNTNKVSDIEDVYREQARLRVLQVERVSYWRQFARGLLSNSAINVLSDAVETATETPGGDLKVEDLKRDWTVSPILARIQSFLQEANNMNSQWEAEANEFCPTQPWRRNLYLFMHQKRVDFVVYLVMLVHAGLVLGELFGQIVLIDRHNKLTTFIIYIFLVAEAGLNVLAARTRYFMRKRNLLEFLFAVIYMVNLMALLVNLRDTHPTIYYILETICLFRLLKFVVFIPYAVPRLLSMVNHRIHEQVCFAYDTAKGFIIGEEETKKQITRLIDDPKLADEFSTMCKRRRLEAIKHLAKLQVDNPGAAIAVKTKQAAQYCLNSADDALSELRESGIVDETEYKVFDKLIEEYMVRVKSAPPTVSRPPLEKQLQHFTWINRNQELIDFILQHSEKKEFMEGEIIMRQGSSPDGLYILTSGMLKVVIERQDTVILEEYMFAGRYFGEMGIITGEPRSATILAEVPSAIYFIPGEKVRRAFVKFHDIYWQFIRSYCIGKCSDLLVDYPAFIGWSDVKLKTHLANGEFVKLDADRAYKRRVEGEIVVLIRGSTVDQKNGTIFHAQPVCLVLPSHAIEIAHVGVDAEPAWLYCIPPNNYRFSHGVEGIVILPDVEKSDAFHRFQSGVERVLHSRAASLKSRIRRSSIGTVKGFVAVDGGTLNHSHDSLDYEPQNDLDQLDVVASQTRQRSVTIGSIKSLQPRSSLTAMGKSEVSWADTIKEAANETSSTTSSVVESSPVTKIYSEDFPNIPPKSRPQTDGNDKPTDAAGAQEVALAEPLRRAFASKSANKTNGVTAPGTAKGRLSTAKKFKKMPSDI